MLRATFYIMACSGKNRLRRRLQRLREPRYLLGALVGSAYLYFSVFGRMRADRSTSNGGRRSAFLPLFGGTGPALAGLLLLLAAGVSFVMPFGSGMLDFSKTETEFLFPAPVSRRQLLLYRLMRSQWAVLLSAAIVALTFPLASPSARLRGLGGAWLLLMTCQVFYTGVTLSRRRSEAGTTRGKWIAWAPRLIVVGAIAVVAREVGQAIGRRAVYTLDDAVSLLVTSLATGLPHVVVWPFVAVLRPLFADSSAQFLLNLPAALAIYGLAIAWVLSADEAFGALAQDSVERQSLRPARKSVADRKSVV